VQYGVFVTRTCLAIGLSRKNDLMSSSFFPFLRFHIVRMLRAQPVAMGFVVLSIALAAVAAMALAGQMRRVSAANAVLAQWQAKPAQVAHAAAPTVSAAALDLPPFQSARVVTILNETASDSGLKLDEVTYSLDDNASQPYLRYRITMTLNASYPLIRRLAEQLNANVPYLTLDAISCSRKDIGVAELSCDMVMSGFFQKASHG
jgi:hypothetical protein